MGAKRGSAVSVLGVKVRREQFLRRTREAIGRVLGTNRVSVFQGRSRIGDLRYLAVPKELVGNGLDVPVTVVTATGESFWLSVAVTFQEEGREQFLMSAQVAVYWGARMGVKDMWIRAEWDLRPHTVPTSEAHAQPHWHVHRPLVESGKGETPEAISLVEALADGLAAEKSLHSILSGDAERARVGEDAGESGVHLAMLADWHTESPRGHVHETDEIGALQWLVATVTYVVAQLQYVARKSGASPRGPE
jgi:hypothetical protein